jgi:hypothetical protein
MAGWPPVPPAEQCDGRWDEQGADQEGIHEDAERQRGEGVQIAGLAHDAGEA